MLWPKILEEICAGRNIRVLESATGERLSGRSEHEG
jgi:hypothetical protein